MWSNPRRKWNPRRKTDVVPKTSRGAAGGFYRLLALTVAGILVLCGCDGLQKGGDLRSLQAESVSSYRLPGNLPDNVTPGTKIVSVGPPFSGGERDPARLLKMREEKLTQILGRPGIVRREASARVWQYRTPSCVLNLYLYNEMNVLRVVYYQFHPVRGASVSSADCFESLLGRAAESVKS